jgi:pyocin large subunit-like protein
VRRRFSGRAERFAAAAFMILFFTIACGSPQTPPTPPTQAQKAKDAVEGNAASSHINRPGIGFASRQKLIDHYRKHGREFGSITMEQYLRGAQELRDRPAGGAILEFTRPDGSVTRFDRKSGDFIAFNRDGVIRTYFRPTDGEAYYQRQHRRTH